LPNAARREPHRDRARAPRRDAPQVVLHRVNARRSQPAMRKLALVAAFTLALPLYAQNTEADPNKPPQRGVTKKVPPPNRGVMVRPTPAAQPTARPPMPGPVPTNPAPPPP